MYDSIDINKLVNCIVLFDETRQEDQRRYDRAFKRLSQLVNRKSASQTEPKNPPPGKQQRITHTFFQQSVSLIRATVTHCCRIHLYYKQLKRIHSKDNADQTHCSIIAIASSRLEIDQSLTISESIERLTKFLGQRSNFRASEQTEKGQAPLYLFDPLFISDYWKQASKFQQENALIIDGAFLTFVSLARLSSALFSAKWDVFRFAFHFKQQSLKFRENNTRNTINAYIQSFFYIAIVDVLKNHTSASPAFFTSNSTLTEMLRFYLLQDSRCKKVTEILHGIIANPTENFLHSITRVCQPDSLAPNHQLIPQVPDLPELDLLHTQYFYPKNLAINTHLNNAITKYEKQYGSIERYVDENINRLDQQHTNRHPYLLCVFGGTGIRTNFYESTGFLVELYLVDLFNQQCNVNGIEANLIYAPHPANGEFPPNALAQLRQRHAYILRDSTFAYFSCDFCISILSSCLFELDWIGAQCYSPLTPEDNIFPAAYMNRIYHPRRHGTPELLETMKQFVNAGIDNGPQNLEEKIKKRLARVLGHNGTNT